MSEPLTKSLAQLAGVRSLVLGHRAVLTQRNSFSGSIVRIVERGGADSVTHEKDGPLSCCHRSLSPSELWPLSLSGRYYAP